MLHMKSLAVGMLSTCCYIVWDDAADTCVVIDPGAEAERSLSRSGVQPPDAILFPPGLLVGQAVQTTDRRMRVRL